jgi:manganese/zinc/iron transport system permease protein
LKIILSRLKRQGYLRRTSEGYFLSDYGQLKAARLVKLHRLWELYLTEYLKIAPDHVHEDADTIEHIITPELERRLEEKLGYPEVDPHNSKIPYN